MVVLRHLIEATALILLFGILRLLPLDAASGLGSFLGRRIGPLMKAHKTAEKNLAFAFPEKSEEERKKILAGMWDNLGRTAAELPHLPGKKLIARVTIIGAKYMQPGLPSLFFSGHLGNWELLPFTAQDQGVRIALAYRQANNPYVDKIVAWLRSVHSSGMFHKGPSGAIKLVRALKSGQSLAMLVDQKMNDGIAVPFFGREAMTAPALAQFSLRYGMPILPARMIRKGGAHFEGAIYSPLAYEKTGDSEKDVRTIMTTINTILESWIREYPEQWFWVHKRWPNA